MKHYMNSSLLYAVLAKISSTFYREFTKIQRIRRPNHTLCSTYPLLSARHGVFPATGVGKELSFTESKARRMLTVYHIGLNLTVVMLVVRGVTQVMGTELSRGSDAAISGIAGIGHILLGVSLVLLLLQIRRSVSAFPVLSCTTKYSERPIPQARYRPLIHFPVIHTPPFPGSTHSASPPYVGSPLPLWRWCSGWFLRGGISCNPKSVFAS